MPLTILQKFNSIDKTRISKVAAEVFNDLKKETKNFTKLTPALKKEFNEIYDKLKGKKPEAIKGTPEYKAFGKKPEKPAQKKPKNVDKKVWDKYKGQGVDIPRDSTRQAKPFGARVKGKKVTRKPTKADYEAGNVYYEYRANRADVRKRPPRLEDGGELGGHENAGGEGHRLD